VIIAPVNGGFFIAQNYPTEINILNRKITLLCAPEFSIAYHYTVPIKAAIKIQIITYETLRRDQQN